MISLQPRQLQRKIKKYLPLGLLIQRLPRTARRSVLLTFDDGPDPDVTQAVLERLDAYDAKGVFFVVGRRIEKTPNVLNEILKRGHIIGNHTYIHSNGVQPRIRDYYRDVKRCQNMVQEITGTRPHLFRPALGKLSIASVTAAKLQRLRLMTWSLDADDWRCRSRHEGENVGHALIERVKPRDIILLHDDNSAILGVLDVLLPALKSQYDIEYLDSKWLGSQ